MSAVLVTGAAGFIGYHVCKRLLSRGERVIGVDNMNEYYEPSLKQARLEDLRGQTGFSFHRLDAAVPGAVAGLMRDADVRSVVHLAAQAGVRYSIDHPFECERSNFAAHLAVLEACRAAGKLEHLVYASSSSVYGERPAAGDKFREDESVDKPVSPYAATKRACELMSTTYGILYGLRQTGLRFFTVYGPYGRPDMAYFLFTRKLFSGEAIEVYGEGKLRRDFTYIDDAVDGLIAVLDRPPEPGENRILNLGNSKPEKLLDFINIIERATGKKANIIFRPMSPGDVTATWADISRIGALVGFQPKVEISEGLPRFVDWYRTRYPLA